MLVISSISPGPQSASDVPTSNDLAKERLRRRQRGRARRAGFRGGVGFGVT